MIAAAWATERAKEHPPTHDRCPWCQEDIGHCSLTGGPNPCEGYRDRVIALHEAANAAEIRIRVDGAGTRRGP